MRLRDWATCLLVFLATLCVSSGAWIIKRPATGGAAWYESIAIAATATNENLSNDTVIIQPVTVTSGNATKLRFGVKLDFGGTTAKIALYNPTTKALVVSGSASTAVGDNGYAEATIASTPVTAGVYWVAFIGSATGVTSIGVTYGGGSGTSFARYSSTYAGFPYSPMDSEGATTALYSAGIYVE